MLLVLRQTAGFNNPAVSQEAAGFRFTNIALGYAFFLFTT